MFLHAAGMSAEQGEESLASRSPPQVALLTRKPMATATPLLAFSENKSQGKRNNIASPPPPPILWHAQKTPAAKGS